MCQRYQQDIGSLINPNKPPTLWCTLKTQIFVYSLILFRLDPFNSLLSGSPQYILSKLQKIQSAAARHVSKTKYLTTLPPYSSNSALAASNASIQNFNYLLQFYLWYIPSVSVRSPSTLHSNKTVTIRIRHPNLVILRENTKTFGERSLCNSGATVWNSLPQALRHSDSSSSSKAALKTQLFGNYF